VKIFKKCARKWIKNYHFFEEFFEVLQARIKDLLTQRALDELHK